jgi:DNA gyrase/topoisomerase IV subunit A
LKKHREKKEVPVKINSKFTTQIMNDVVKKNMFEYGIDVIEDRALQDFRDGFKPVQRRLIQSMCDLHAYSTSSTLKCARITGDAMGKYHPHSSGYGALTTLATDYCPIVYGQGNFGSLTNGPAAERYTEARLSKIGMKVIECNDVMETVPNYSGELLEPVVFPSRLPLYFINGGSGIAVGLSCNMPSFNILEVSSALKYVVRKGEAATVSGIFKRMPGPDYRYGGRLLSNDSEIKELYKTGVGALKYSCDYEISKNDKGVKIEITGFCPTFDPTSFLLKMSDLQEKGIIEEASDNTDEERGNCIEVYLKSHSLFDKYVKKFLEKSVSYRFYALEREKAIDNPEKDIDVTVKSPGILELMQMWVDWRRVIETKMKKLELKRTRDKLFKDKVRLSAACNIDIIMDSVKQDKIDPSEYLIRHLPILKEYVKKDKKDRALEGANYIGSQQIFSLKKADVPKIEQNILDYLKQIKKIKFDIEHIDLVVIEQLNELSEIKYLDDSKEISSKRKIKLPGSFVDIQVTKSSLDDYAVAGIDDEGKHDVVDIKGKKKTQFTRFASTLDKLIISNEESKTLTMDVHEFGGREKRWGTTGIANGDCSRLMYRTNTGKISVVNNEGSDIFTGVKLKNDEKIVQMEGIYKGSLFIVFSGTNAVKIMKSDEYDSARKNSASKTSKTGFKDIRKLVVCHKGCSLLTNRMKLIEPDDVKKDTKIIGMVGDRNIVILEDGKKEYSTKKDICDLKHVAYVIPLKFSGRNEKPKQKEK